MQLPRNWEEKKLNKKLDPKTLNDFALTFLKKDLKIPPKNLLSKTKNRTLFFIKKNLTVYCQMTSRRKILTFQKFC